MMKKMIRRSIVGTALLAVFYATPVYAAQLTVQKSDVITVLKNCSPYFIAIGVILIAAIAFIVYCKKFEKTKKKDGEMSIELDRTQDILKYLGEHRREGQFYCGFSMETQNMLENSRVKLDKKNIDMVVANNLKIAGSGFGTDTNVVTMISKEEEIQLELLSKAEVAHKILDEILKLKAIKG